MTADFAAETSQDRGEGNGRFMVMMETKKMRILFPECYHLKLKVKGFLRLQELKKFISQGLLNRKCSKLRE
jgi:hypothetical protein